MPRHTPGPWRIGLSSKRTHYALTPSGYVVAEIPRDRNYKPAATANATLIAAAPEMRDALAGLLAEYIGLAQSGVCGPWDPEESPAVRDARAALEKAGG